MKEIGHCACRSIDNIVFLTSTPRLRLGAIRYWTIRGSHREKGNASKIRKDVALRLGESPYRARDLSVLRLAEGLERLRLHLFLLRPLEGDEDESPDPSQGGLLQDHRQHGQLQCLGVEFRGGRAFPAQGHLGDPPLCRLEAAPDGGDL